MSSLNGALHATGDRSVSKIASTLGRVLAIAGCTNSGKTTIAKLLTDKLTEDGVSVHVIHQDEFFYPEDKVEKIHREIGSQPSFFYNYDAVSAVDHENLLRDIKAASLAYDYTVIEGNMLTEFVELIWLCDRVMFLTLDQETCRRRRSKRSYDPPDMPGYFDEVVWPSYEQHLLRALIFARKSGRISFYDVTTDSERPDPEFMISLIRSFSTDIVRICCDPLDVDEAMRLVTSPSSGATSLYIGTATADSDDVKKVLRLEYESNDELAHKELRNLCGKVRSEYPSVDRVVIFHRVGKVPVGEKSVVIATSSPHRQTALNATEMAVDELEKITSIRRKVVYENDDCSWKQNDRCNENGETVTTDNISSAQISGLQQNGMVNRMNAEPH